MCACPTQGIVPSCADVGDTARGLRRVTEIAGPSRCHLPEVFAEFLRGTATSTVHRSSIRVRQDRFRVVADREDGDDVALLGVTSRVLDGARVGQSRESRPFVPSSLLSPSPWELLPPTVLAAKPRRRRSALRLGIAD